MSPVRSSMVPCLLLASALACLAGCRSGQPADSTKDSVEAQPLIQTAPSTPAKEVPMSVMIDIPAGPFMMGGQPHFYGTQPVHEVFVSGFSIGKYEVTVLQYMACEADGSCTRPVKTFESPADRATETERERWALLR